MSTNAFRSPLMQQWVAAAARGQHRPPIALSSHLSSSSRSQNTEHHHKAGDRGTTNVCEGGNAKIGKNSRQYSPSRPSNAKSRLTYVNMGSTNSAISSHLALQSSQSTTTQRNFQMRAKSTDVSAHTFDGIQAEDNYGEECAEYEPQSHPSLFQDMIQSRRTTSAFNPVNEAMIPQIRDAITRSIQCATKAPNHHRTEPTTYYRILHSHSHSHSTPIDLDNDQSQSSPSLSISTHQKLMNICYNVTLWRNLKSGTKSLQEAKQSAKAKRDKWRNTIGGYIVVTVGNQPIQDDENESPMNEEMELRLTDDSDGLLSFEMQDASERWDELLDFEEEGPNRDLFRYWYDVLPVKAPQTERQLEDYASACASIQNILLSLHSESTSSFSQEELNLEMDMNMGTKWATGPMIRCRAMRKLIGCKVDDALVGLVMVGDQKISPAKDWRRRRDFMGDVLRDL